MRSKLFSSNLQPCFSQIKERIDVLLNIIIDSLTPMLSNLLSEVTAYGFASEQAQTFFDFLNFQLAPLAETFYPQVSFFKFQITFFFKQFLSIKLTFF